MIKAVIFDLAGTYISHAYPSVFKASSKYYNVPINIIGKVLEECLTPYFQGKITEYNYWRNVEKKLKVEPKKVIKFWTELYLKNTHINSGMEKLVKDLKKAGFKLGIISNTAGSHVKDNRRAKRLALFDRFVYSNEVKVTKPNIKIYSIMLRKLRVKSSECVFIDDVASYLLPAKRLGMKTIHYKNARNLRKELKQYIIF